MLLPQARQHFGDQAGREERLVDGIVQVSRQALPFFQRGRGSHLLILLRVRRRDRGPCADVADDTQQARPGPIDAPRPVYLDGERRAVLPHVNNRRLDCVAGLNGLHPLAEPGITGGLHEGPRVQANERLRSIAVHGARRRVSLDHQAGFQIVEDQSVTHGLEEASIGLLRVIAWQGMLLIAGSRNAAKPAAKSVGFNTYRTPSSAVAPTTCSYLLFVISIT